MATPKGRVTVVATAGTFKPNFAAADGRGGLAELQVEPAVSQRARDLAEDYRDVAVKILQHRGAFQVVDALRQIDGSLAQCLVPWWARVRQV